MGLKVSFPLNKPTPHLTKSWEILGGCNILNERILHPVSKDQIEPLVWSGYRRPSSKLLWGQKRFEVLYQQQQTLQWICFIFILVSHLTSYKMVAQSVVWLLCTENRIPVYGRICSAFTFFYFFENRFNIFSPWIKSSLNFSFNWWFFTAILYTITGKSTAWW